MAQAPKKIIIENSDYFDINQVEAPDATLLTGNVRVNHDGVIMTCNKAYYFQKENYIKAFGNVQLVQGDTLYLNSKYAEYNGNVKQAFATGEAIMRSPESTLVTDTINFNRNTQEVYYNSNGTINNRENTLKSKSGKYYVAQKKFQFLTAVTITNPKYVIKSNHLDYYSNSGHSYLFGPSTITSKANYIYTEKGFYDTKKNVSHFLRKSYIKYDDRLIEGDSLYYDRNREFASATRNVKITDSINRGIVRGHYAELFQQIAKQGFLKVRVNGDIKDITTGMKLDRYKTHDIEIVIDRMIIEDTPDNEKRLTESIKTAMYHGENVLMILDQDTDEIRFFSRNLMCPTTGISYQNPEPNLFSFNSPKGACDHCKGLGTVNEINIKKIIPNPKLSINKGGFAPLGEYKSSWMFKQLEIIGEKYGFKLTDPISTISEEAMEMILNGGKEKFSVESKVLGVTKEYKIEFEGIAHFIKNQHDESGSTTIRRWAKEFMDEVKCPI